MIVYLAHVFNKSGIFNVLSYTSTRALMGFIFAFILSLLMGRRVIQYLFLAGFRDYPRDYGEMSVSDKRGTPTMGGALIVLVAMISILLCCDWTETRVWIVLASMVTFGAIGFYDDYGKAITKSAEGGATRIIKVIPQIAFGALLGWLAVTNTWHLFPSGFGDAIVVPFLKTPLFNVSWAMVLLGIMWSGGISNAVNYTDGLDGLLAVPAFFCFLVLAVFSYVMGNSFLAEYLYYDYLAGVEELSIICSIFMGACLGFLWFNAFPAEVFMGDFGSLLLGGVLMTISFLIHQEVILLIAGAIFVFQLASSFVQEQFFKYKGMRLFRAAPYHEGLVKNYLMAESKVVVRFWIVAAILAASALITLKIR